MTKKSIKPSEYYSLTELAKRNVFSWVSADYRNYRKLVDKDRNGKNVLKAIVQGEENGTRIKILGSNAMAFKSKVESGDYKL